MSHNLEQAIRAAGNYVRPTSDLRPRIIEAAKDQCGQRRTVRRVGGSLAALCLFVALVAPAVNHFAERLEQSQPPSTIEIQQQAANYATQRKIGANFGLYEAFSKLRQAQAERFLKSPSTPQ